MKELNIDLLFSEMLEQVSVSERLLHLKRILNSVDN
jgi:hypothetical protein